MGLLPMLPITLVRPVVVMPVSVRMGPWGSDNQIIASVRTLVGECALALGRAQPEWKDTPVADVKNSTKENKGLSSDRLTSGRLSIRKHLSRRSLEVDVKGWLLIVCARDECGGPARLLQLQLGAMLQCKVVISSNDVDAWRSEVDFATHTREGADGFTKIVPTCTLSS